MTQSQRSQIYQWLLVLVLGAMVIALFLVYVRYPAWDFRNNLWGPAHLLLHDEPPYDREALQGLTATWGVPFYLSIWFPTIVGAALPLGALPLPYAAHIWLFLSLMAVLCTVGLVHRNFGLADSRRALYPLLFTVVLFAPLYAHLMQGQVSLITLVSLVVGWVLLEQDHPSWAGLCLSIGWAKPQLVLLAWPTLAWLALEQGNFRPAFRGWLIGSLAQTLPLWLLDPTWLNGYWAALRANPTWLQPNLYSLLAFVTNRSASSWILTLVALALGAAWIARVWKKQARALAFSWALALTPTLSPYTWSYDQVLLIPLLVMTFRLVSPGRRALAWVAFGACQVVYLALRLQTSSDAWYAWYPAALMLLSAWVTHPLGKPPTEDPDCP